MDINVGKIPELANGIGEAVSALNITLLNIAVDNDLTVFTNAGQKHFHLGKSRVLRFIQHHKGAVIKSFAAHKRQRRCHNTTVSQAVVHRPRAQSLIENIAKGINIDGEFFIQGTGQEAQLLAGLDRGAVQDNTPNPARLQRLRCQCPGTITFTGARRSNTEGQAVFINRIDISLLGGGSGAERVGSTLGSVSGFELLGAGFYFDNIAILPSLSSGRLPSRLAGLAIVLGDIVSVLIASRVRFFRHGSTL